MDNPNFMTWLAYGFGQRDDVFGYARRLDGGARSPLGVEQRHDARRIRTGERAAPDSAHTVIRFAWWEDEEAPGY